MNSEFAQKQVVINGLLTNYYAANDEPASGRAVVFLHGWRSNGNIWKPIMFNLAKRGVPVYALDLAGFGKSQAPKQAFTISDYAAVVSAFLNKLKLPKVVLAGHSFGGRIGIVLAAEHPELVDRLVLVSAAGKKNTSWNKRIKWVIAKILKPIFALPGLGNLREKIYAGMGAEDYVATPQLKQTFLNVINEDLQGQMRRIKLPTLIIWGRDDAETPLSLGMLMNKLISGSEFHAIDHAGHYSFIDNPQEFVRILAPFLNV